MKLANLYFNVHMAYGHDGLKKIHRSGLSDGECAIFINKKWTALKILTPANIILHLRQPNNRPIRPEAIKYLPNCVQGNEINYSAALKSSIDANFKKVYPK